MHRLFFNFCASTSLSHTHIHIHTPFQHIKCRSTFQTILIRLPFPLALSFWISSSSLIIFSSINIVVLISFYHCQLQVISKSFLIAKQAIIFKYVTLLCINFTGINSWIWLSLMRKNITLFYLHLHHER